MILYLSAAAEDEDFAELLRRGLVTGGHQAQKFNSLVIKGLAAHTSVNAISNPPYADGAKGEGIREKQCGNIHYTTLSVNPGKLHKLQNVLEMRAAIRRRSREEKPEAVICDAISPLPSLCGLLAARRYQVPAIAIVTDIPEYMDAGNVSFFTKLTSFLMKKYSGYVFLTEAMNPLENKHNRPYIIMEGLCDVGEAGDAARAEPNEAFTCVYTGSLSENTGLEELLEAFSDSALENIRLQIYGGGALADRVRQAESRHPNIHYGGIVNNRDAVQAQKRADLLINPRPANILYGNVSFPSKIMEYMVSGTPVLTTRLPGIPKAYFDYVYSMDDNSPKEIIQHIKSISSETAQSRAEKGQKARGFVLEEKNNLRQSARILELIRKAK